MHALQSPIEMTTVVPEQQPQQSYPANLQEQSAVDGIDADLERCDSQNHSYTRPPVDPSIANNLPPGWRPNQRPIDNSQGPYPRNTFNPLNPQPDQSPEGPMSCADREPYRYRGYPAMCTWMASDDDFFVVRKFSKLSARVVLLMQNRIVKLEKIVHAEDAKCIEGEYKGENGSFNLDLSIARQRAMDELVGRLDQYQRFVLDHSKLKARPDATKRQISNVKNWLHNTNQPILQDEVSFIDEDGDLMPMVPRVKPPLRRFLDRFDIIGRISYFRRKEKQLDQRHFQSETTIYNIEERIDKVVTIVTIVLGLSMLIAPLWVLQYFYTEQPDMKTRLEIITGFLIGFTFLLSIVTVARPFEVLAATAAYGAVLMVFMQLGDPGSARARPSLSRSRKFGELNGLTRSHIIWALLLKAELIMATQDDGLDISQLKDIILSSAPEAQADAVAELLQHGKGQHNLRQKRQQPSNSRKVNKAPDADELAGHNPSSIDAPKPPCGSPLAHHPAVRLSASQPELPSTIPDSAKTRMNLLGSQSQGDTQPISQWAVEAWTKNRTLELQSAAKLSSNGYSTGANSTERTYLPGQTGHVDLMAFIENPSPLDDDEHYADEDVEDDPTAISQPQDVRAELFPESERFRPPKTPASHNRKRKRDADITPQEQSTPSLPINPFAGQFTGVEGLMDPSQLFKATQAPSSPFPGALHSDGLSSRPSPNLHNLHGPSTADAASSPVKRPRSSMTRSITEPQTTYISMKESQEERERRLKALREKEEQAMLVDSDDGFDSDDSVQRRQNRERQLEHSSRALFSAIKAPLRPSTDSRGRERGRGRGRGSGISHSELRTRSATRYSSAKGEPVLISDDPLPEAVSVSSEDETEFEEDPTQVDASEPEDVVDEDKENIGCRGIQIPRTASKPKAKLGAARDMPASPSSGRSRLPPGPKMVSPLDTASAQTDDVPRATPSCDVADSQTSGKALPALQPSISSSTQPWVPASSPSSRSMVPQSQLPQGSRSSPASKDEQTNQNDRPKVTERESRLVSNSPGADRPDRVDDGLPFLPAPVDRSGEPLQGPVDGFRQSEVHQVSCQEQITSEQSTHNASLNSEISRSEAANTVERGAPNRLLLTAQPATASSTIPESSAGDKPARSSQAPASAPAGIENDRNDGVPVSARSTVFESAQTHLTMSPATPRKASKAFQTQHNQPSPIRHSSRLRTMAEIAAQPTPSDAIGSIDVDIDLMTTDDLEFHSIVSGSSPVAPARKFRRGTNVRPMRLTGQNASATSSSPLSSPPDVQNMSRGHPSSTPITENTEPAQGSVKKADPMNTSLSGQQVPQASVRPGDSSPKTSRKPTSRLQRLPAPDIQSEQPKADCAGNKVVQDVRRSSQRFGPKPRAISEARAGQSETPDALANPARVLALFTGNVAGYYPATCIGLVPGEELRYKVRFDDDEVGIVAAYNVKRLELRNGDNVKVDMPNMRTKTFVVVKLQGRQQPEILPDPETPSRRGRPHQIRDPSTLPTDVHGHTSVTVTVRQRQSIGDAKATNQQTVVPLAYIYLAPQMWTNFKDRPYHYEPEQTNLALGLPTPSDRPSTPTTPSSRTRRAKTLGTSIRPAMSFSNHGAGLFGGMVFAITN
ncbi:MAG: hypothetical protein L6R42_004448, partial [Xanthoria sp. 1 TBL-2021]